MEKINDRIRFPLMAMGFLALLAALWAGLIRLGWTWPVLRPTLPVAHGPLMVCGFLGTVIGVERAVALNRPWTYAGPLLTGLGGLVLIAGVPGPAGALLITLGSLGLVLVFVHIVRVQPALYTATMALGAWLWLIGNGLWLAGRSIPTVVVWWSAFLLLTIAGERLELSRVLRLPDAVQRLFVAALAPLLAGLLLSPFNLDAGVRLGGLGMAALALWLLRYDVARYTARKTGLTRFIAVCLLSGYVWLGISGILALAFGGVAAGPRYDALLHTFYLGFVISMIFGHAPIIFPAVIGKEVPFAGRFYAHLLLLHVSLLARVIGDLAGWLPARQWGGLLNGVALLLFLANTVRSVRQAPVPGAGSAPESIPVP
ncbi:MAG: hypothetical protein ACE5H9_20345 [Anaerolineae bacterium]